ncbi:consortin, connexin sorting protein b isoform X2 [Silurus meridionalis]|uniref:Consortin C-terminal domain-containing protein n=1 Tax=Silurus meridionalis TaxID=175797 RepID=A0A8T0AF62_SILME|nr:consortin, connexin sorting protein b isoform X2 [Silurus meridionalis]KAF7690081.1 hypothetical protein HF521_011885 [Silurus meridionalis]
MGDPKPEEYTRGNYDPILPCSSPETIPSSDLFASHENQDKLIIIGGFDLVVEKTHIMKNNPEKKYEKNSKRVSSDTTESGNSTPGPSPAFVAALSTLGEHNDHMLLPRSLHQIAEAYFLEEDYQWAIQFLNLEMLYHERLLSNLASMQRDWDSHWKTVSQAKNRSPVNTHSTEAETKCMSSLSRICRTHQRPNCSVEKVSKLSIKVGEQTSSINSTKMKEWTEQTPEDEARESDESLYPSQSLMKEVEEKEATRLIEVEETFPSNGLISILKKRPDESGPANPSAPRGSSKLKVRFSETDSFLDNDEVGEDSCLFFLVLCLVMVAISMGGTMLFCFLGGAYSNICTDFSHNMDLFFSLTRWVEDILTHWFIPASS